MIAFQIYKSFIEIDEYKWIEDTVCFGIVFIKFEIAMAINSFLSKCMYIEYRRATVTKFYNFCFVNVAMIT